MGAKWGFAKAKKPSAHLTSSLSAHRNALLQKVLAKQPGLVITDGAAAIKVLNKFLGEDHFIAIEQGDEPAANIIESASAIAKTEMMQDVDFDLGGRCVDIPRNHLAWIARVWEGTCGDGYNEGIDHVITAKRTDTKFFGKAFAVVAPNWARFNEVYFAESSRANITAMRERLARAGEPQPEESLQEFIERRANCHSQAELKRLEQGGLAADKEPCDVTIPPSFPSDQ